MPLKQPEILSRGDFDEAVVKLRLNVSEVAKETNIPRTYLSEFRNGDRKLRPEHLAKLRDYFEEKGIEFDATPESKQQFVESALPQSPHPKLSVGTVCFFPIRPDLQEARVREVMSEIERNDRRIAQLLTTQATRSAALIGEGKFSGDTQDSIRELFALCAANYVLVRYLTGTANPLAQKAGLNSLGAILLDTLSESVERAGIEVPAMEHEEEAA